MGEKREVQGKARSSRKTATLGKRATHLVTRLNDQIRDMAKKTRGLFWNEQRAPLPLLYVYRRACCRYKERKEHVIAATTAPNDV